MLWLYIGRTVLPGPPHDPPIRIVFMLPAECGKFRVVVGRPARRAKATVGRPHGDAASLSPTAIERQDLPPKLPLIAPDKPGLSRTDMIQNGQALRCPGSNRPCKSIPVVDDAVI